MVNYMCSKLCGSNEITAGDILLIILFQLFTFVCQHVIRAVGARLVPTFFLRIRNYKQQYYVSAAKAAGSK